ncbi:TPA: helix-turn-helix domain-containing protein [Pseudomonas aeruginosa]|nr:helix-turn-helix domain-containing protein [Pseudomonas aeruginosa]HBP6652547.1 helix-turn-helix domain-containing protein [Pseudomonas aeruginosa]
MSHMKKDSFSGRWDEKALEMGWTAIPNALFFMQRPLNLSPTNFNVLLNLFIHWWEAGTWPYPSQKGLASRMGVSVRTIQRALDEMTEMGFIKKTTTMRNHPRYKGRNIYELTPVIHMIEIMAPELKKTIGKKKEI